MAWTIRKTNPIKNRKGNSGKQFPGRASEQFQAVRQQVKGLVPGPVGVLAERERLGKLQAERGVW